MADVNELPHTFSKETRMATEFLIYGSRVLVIQQTSRNGKQHQDSTQSWKARLQFAVGSDGEAGGKLINALTCCMKLCLSHT